MVKDFSGTVLDEVYKRFSDVVTPSGLKGSCNDFVKDLARV